MDIKGLVLFLLSLHVTGAILWCILYIKWCIDDGTFDEIFNEAQGERQLSERLQNKLRIAIVFSLFLTSLYAWEISCYRTIKNSYKNFM